MDAIAPGIERVAMASNERPDMRHVARYPAVVVLTMLVALAGCAQATASGAITTPSATATLHMVIRQGPQLTWQAVPMPPVQTNMPFAIASSDGDVAYGCAVVQPKGDGTTHTWVTRDRGQHWIAGGNIAGPTGVTTCNLTVDNNNAHVVVATLSTASGGSQPPVFIADSSYASFDGGGTWRELGAGEAISHVASFNGMYYAARTYEASATSPMIGNLAVSTDQMATWLPIGPDQSFAGAWFWLNPLTGSLLATSGGGTNGGGTNGDAKGAYIRSDDGGTHWSPVNVPSWTQSILPAPQSGAQPWQICAVATSMAGNPAAENQIACSLDGGQTWTARPALYLTNLSPKGFTYIQPAFVFAIANDGAMLATATDSNAITQLYRLPAGSSTWQTMGPLSGIASCSYSTAPGAGVLWENMISSPNPYLTANYPAR